MALLLALLLCLILTPIPRRLGWVDKPDWRKQHAGEIPLVGGPAVFLAVLGVLAWQGGWSEGTQVLVWSSAIVLVAGFVDDRRHVWVPLRLALQIAALLCMVYFGHVQLYNFGFLFWEGWLGLGPLAVPITVCSALGVINAFNMIDGLDGLSGSLALIALGSGGIKPCVSANVGDQFGERNQHLLSKAFSWFYFSINFGSFFSTMLTPFLLEPHTEGGRHPGGAASSSPPSTASSPGPARIPSGPSPSARPAAPSR